MAISRTDYFTYVSGADNKLHRQQLQVWNHKNISIVLQSDDLAAYGITPDGGSNATFFAKKHLLTHAGGGAASIAAKASNIAQKRAPLPNALMKKIRNGADDAAVSSWLDANEPQNKDEIQKRIRLRSKYSSMPAKNNTFIVCDRVAADVLKDAFADALLAASGAPKRKGNAAGGDPTASVVLPGDAVITLLAGGVATDLGTGSQTAEVTVCFAANSDNTKFAVLHLSDQKIAAVQNVAPAPKVQKS